MVEKAMMKRIMTILFSVFMRNPQTEEKKSVQKHSDIFKNGILITICFTGFTFKDYSDFKLSRLFFFSLFLIMTYLFFFNSGKPHLFSNCNFLGFLQIITHSA